MNKNILLIIDPQNDFIDGSLAVKGAKEAIHKLSEFINETKGSYDLIIMTMDWHPATHCSFDANGGVWPPHCVENTDGARISLELMKAIANNGLRCMTLPKGTNEDREEYSIFKNPESSTKLMEILSDEDVKQVDICGIALDYCVKETIDGAIKNGLGQKLKLLKEFSPAIGDPEDVYKYLEDENIPIC